MAENLKNHIHSAEQREDKGIVFLDCLLSLLFTIQDST